MRRYFESGFGPVLNKRLEMTALHRDGREFPVELAIAPVVVEDEVYFSAAFDIRFQEPAAKSA